jgi:hypothetical protein
VEVTPARPPLTMESDRYPMVEMRSRDGSLLDALSVEYRQVARIALFIKDVGQEIAFALGRVTTARHKNWFCDSVARAGSIDFHLPAHVIEVPDAAMERVIGTWPADTRDIAMPIAKAKPPFVDARILTSLLAKAFDREISRLTPIELPSS